MSKYVLIALFAFNSIFALANDENTSRLLKEETLSKKDVLGSCAKLDLGESKLDCTTCKVVDIQNIGDVASQKLSMARYEYSWSKDSGLKTCGYGYVVLKQADSSVEYKTIWGGFSGIKSDEAPQFFKINGEILLKVPIRASGTGALEDDGLIAFKNGSWHEIDTKAYQADLKKRIPTELNIRKGLYPDYNNMAVESGLWKKDDPECCSSGGKFTARLALEDDKLVIKEYRLESSKK